MERMRVKKVKKKKKNSDLFASVYPSAGRYRREIHRDAMSVQITMLVTKSKK